MNTRTRLLGAFILPALLSVLDGCGGGGASSPPPPPPPIPEVITITTNPNVQGVISVPFSLTLQETGATSAVTWSVASGSLPPGLTLDAASGTISGTPTTGAGFAATIKVADTKASATSSFNFLIWNKLAITPTIPPAAHLSAPYSLPISTNSALASVSVPTGQLPPGLSLGLSSQNANWALISGTPTQSGSYTFTVQVQDSTIPQTATAQMTIVVDTHLAITKATLKNGGQNQIYSDSFIAVNGTAPFQWTISGNLPGGVTLNAATGQVAGTPTGFGQYIYTVSVSDSSNPAQSDSGSGTWNVAQQLQIIGTYPTAYIGVSYFQSIFATGGSYPYTWTIASGSLPPGLSFGNSQISGTPTQLGTYNFVVQVTDSGSPPYVVSAPMQLAVTPVPLSVFGGPLSPAPVNTLYHSQIPANGGTPPFFWSIASGQLPPGLALDPSTGYIDGTPTQLGTFNFLAKATDSGSPPQTATANDFIQINPRRGRNDSIATATPLGNSASITNRVPFSISPYIDPINATTPNPDTDFYKLVAAGGSTVHLETYAQRSWSFTALDTVLEILDAGGTRLHTCGAPAYTSVCLNDNLDSTTLDSALDLLVPGTPSTQTTFYAHVFDWRGDARPDMQYYFNVSGVVEPLAISPSTLGPGATRGVSYQQQFTNTGGTGSVTWTVDSGSLPTGWSLSSTGLLSGVATTDGPYSFTIKATDSANPPQIARTSYTLLIAEPVVITSSPTFPNACVGTPYSFTVQTTGGIPPIQFSFWSNAWPINLNPMTGTFSGTAGSAGTFVGSLGAIDSAQPPSTSGQNISLTVVNPPCP